MKRRPTMLMGVLFALFASGLWYFDLSQETEGTGLENPSEIELLADADWGSLQRIELDLRDERVVLERRAGTEADGPSWRLVEPVDAAADEGATESILRELRGLAGEAVATVAEHGLDAYGLEPGAGRVRLVFEVGGGKGRIERVLRIGGDTPIDHQVYLWVEGRADIHVTPAYLRTALDRTPHEMRRKKLVRFSAFDVLGLTLEAGGPPIVLNRESDGWWIEAPVRARARAEAVDALVDGLTGLRATSFLPPEAASADVEANRLRIEVRVEGRERPERVEVAAGEGQEGFAVVRTEELPGGALVRVAALEALDIEVDELRDRRLVVFDRDAVEIVEILGPGIELRVQRAARGGAPAGLESRGWELQTPEGGLEADPVNVNQMLISLASLEVVRWVESEQGPSPSEAGLEQAHRELRLLAADERELVRIKIGDEVGGGEAPSVERYARASGGAGVVVVSGAFLEDVPSSRDELLPTPAGAASPSPGEHTEL